VNSDTWLPIWMGWTSPPFAFGVLRDLSKWRGVPAGEGQREMEVAVEQPRMLVEGLIEATVRGRGGVA